MPPKPWEKKGRISDYTDNLSKQIEMNNSETTKQAEQLIAQEPTPDPQQSAAKGNTSNLDGDQSTGGLGNTMNSNRYGNTGYGSSMYGGGYGSSMYGGGMYGGGMYGGGMYGGMGGMYGGMGGMYGNRFGMMGGDPNNPGMLQSSMQYLDSLGYVIMSLTEISRNLEMNAEGLGRFWGSLQNLAKRIKGWGFSLVQSVVDMFVNIVNGVNNYIKKKIHLFTSQEQNHLHYQKKVLQISMKILAFLLVISFFPTIRSMLQSNDDLQFEAAFKE